MCRLGNIGRTFSPKMLCSQISDKKYLLVLKPDAALTQVVSVILFLFQDVSKLHPLSPEIISRQATINIGKSRRKRDLKRGNDMIFKLHIISRNLMPEFF